MLPCRSFALALVASFLSLPAVAQTRFCVGGDLSQLTPAERASCNAQMAAVRTTVNTLNAPADWHFVVVCGEQGWKDYAAYSLDDARLANADADTSLERRETFFRQSRLEQGGRKTLESVVSREVAAILVNSQNAAALRPTRPAHPESRQTAGL